MFPLATGSRNRIWSYMSYCVRALLSICRYICDLWEHHCFGATQWTAHLQNSTGTCMKAAKVGLLWRMGWLKLEYLYGGYCQTFIVLLLPPCNDQRLRNNNGVKEKTNNAKPASEKKMHMWNWRAKSPIKFTTELFIWISIFVVGLSLSAEPYALKVVWWMPSKVLWRLVMMHCKSSFAPVSPVLFCTGNKLLYSFWHVAFHRGGWKINTRWKTILFQHTGCKNEVPSGLIKSE